MTKRVLTALFSVVILVCVAGCADTTSLSMVKSANFYDMYDAVLIKFIGNKKGANVSIVKTTAYQPSFQNCLLKAHKSAQWKSMVADFKQRNKIPHLLTNKFHLPFQYKLVDKMVPVGGVRAPPKGVPYSVFIKNQLATLKKMTKEHRSQAQFSVPGISARGDIAIVYMADSFSGNFWVLRKHNANWETDGAVCGWIS